MSSRSPLPAIARGLLFAGGSLLGLGCGLLSSEVASDTDGPDPGGPATTSETTSAGGSSGPATAGTSTSTASAGSSDATGPSGSATASGGTATATATSTTATSTTASSTGDAGAFDGSPLAEPVTTEVFDFLAMEVADVDGDGRADLILQGTGAPPRVTIYPGQGDGGFGAGVTTEVWTFAGLVAGDVDGDGAADVLTAGTGFPPRVHVHRGALGSLGVAHPGEVTEVWSFDPARMVVADLDADGRRDLILDNDGGAPPTLFFHRGEAGGALSPLGEAQVWSYDVIAAGDGDGDVITGSGEGFPRIWIWPGDGAGGLGDAIPSDAFTFSLLDAGDLDGDGRIDVITDVPGNAWRLQLYRGLGDGHLAPPVDHEGWNFEDLEVGDVNGDGKDDVITRPTGFPPRVDVYLAL